MNGERKMPTITLTASADQLEPTFFRICLFSNLRMSDGDCYVPVWSRAMIVTSLLITSLYEFFFLGIIASLSFLLQGRPLIRAGRKPSWQRSLPGASWV